MYRTTRPYCKDLAVEYNFVSKISLKTKCRALYPIKMKNKKIKFKGDPGKSLHKLNTGSCALLCTC